MRDSADAAAWLQVAETDLDMARMALGKAYAGQAAFHVQQAVEKTLKGLLVAAGVEPPRTHDLGFLHQLVGDLDMEIARAIELAGELLRRARSRIAI